MPSELRPGLQYSGTEHVSGLVDRLRLGWLLKHFPPLLVRTLYVFVNGFITIALLSLLAVLTGTAFVFPSLGPTAYLFFFSPLAESASPKNAILGHAIGLACGYGAFRFAVEYGPVKFHDRIDWPTILAAALSLALTGAFMVLLRISHPPAGATTLIVSLGILSTLRDLVIIEAAVALLTVQAFVINRLAGLPYPIWNHKFPVP
ncbi:MAG: HPP family protein [Acidobacteriota bacterium]|nr:HPP family protein [Acidobacteriota bacterium]